MNASEICQGNALLYLSIMVDLTKICLPKTSSHMFDRSRRLW